MNHPATLPSHPMPTTLHAESTRPLWSDLFLPAVLGETDEARHALRILGERNVPNRGDVLAIAARAAFALGDHARGLALWREASALPSREAEALSVFLAPDGRRWAEIRCHEALNPGLFADASADLMLVCFRDGHNEQALLALREGLKICPEHGELGRWRRFLAKETNVRIVNMIREKLLQALDPRGPSSSLPDDEGPAPIRTDVEIGDLEALIPTAASGYLPPERIARRIVNGTYDAPALRGNALARIQDAGVANLHFASPEELLALPEEHHLVEMEIYADRMESLLDEERPAIATMLEFWRRAQALPPAITQEALAIMATNAFTHPMLATTVLRAIDWMIHQIQRFRSARWELDLYYWNACKARLYVTLRRPAEARKLALPICEMARAKAGTWLLAFEALRLSGNSKEIRGTLSKASSDPVVGELAREIARTWHASPMEA